MQGTANFSSRALAIEFLRFAKGVAIDGDGGVKSGVVFIDSRQILPD